MKFLKPNYKLAPHIILQEIMSLEENFFKSNMRKKDVTFGRSEKTTIYTDTKLPTVAVGFSFYNL